MNKRQSWDFPIAITPQDAEDKRLEIAAALRRMADDIESGTVLFADGEKLTIEWSRPSAEFAEWLPA